MSLAIVRFLLMIATAFVMAGLTGRVKARWVGRCGPPLLQPLYDVLKLLRKDEVVSPTASIIFKLAPAITLAALLTAGLVLPVGGGQAVVHFSGDFVFFAYLLAVARFFTALGALDTGSGFGGLGASRGVTFSALAAPSFFIALGSLSVLTGMTSISGIISMVPSLNTGSSGNASFFVALVETANAWSHSKLLVPVIVSTIVLGVSIIIDAGRMPIDDPDTPNELNMVHEAMVLEMSGPDLALMRIASILKTALYGTLITGLFIPSWIHPIASISTSLSTSISASLALYLFFMLIIALVLGVIESTAARIRMSCVPQFVLGATSIALIALAVLMVGRQ